MSRPRRILVIAGKKKIVQKAKALGLDVVFVQKPRDFDASFLPYIDRLELLDFEDLSALLPAARALFRDCPFESAISLTEDGLMPTAHVVEALGLPGTSVETVRLLKDKWAMRRRLEVLGINGVAARVGREPADVQRFASQYGLPMIVKPRDGAGSSDVVCIRQPGECEAAWRSLSASGHASWLMEEFLDGPEISVEAFSFDGQHVVLAITDKVTLPNMVERGHSMPADLDPPLRAQVVQAVTTFLTAVGLRHGPSHTELKLTPAGPRIVESHNRIGGDRINEMVRIVCGLDMDALALGWPFGLAGPFEAPPAARAGAAIRFFTPEPGQVREISGVEQVEQADGVVELDLTCHVGDWLPPIRRSEDRVGSLLVRGASARAAVATCERLLSQVRIGTAPRIAAAAETAAAGGVR